MCEFNKSGLVDAYVLTFDGGHRADASIGAYGWSVWSVKNDVWQFIHGEGRATRDPTTVNIEEFSGVREGLVKTCLVRRFASLVILSWSLGRYNAN